MNDISRRSASDKAKRLFLTGGSGFVGRNIIRRYEIVALVRTDRAAEVVRELGATPFRGNLIESALIEGMTNC